MYCSIGGMSSRILRVVPILALAGASSLWAVPTLQLDILGGVYNTTTETTVATSPSFTLRALDMNGSSTSAPTATYFISAAIEPLLSSSSSVPNFGSVVINGTTYSSTVNSSSWHWGSPPLNVPDSSSGTGPGNLASHGEFPTWYLELAFTFDNSHKVSAYNTADHTSALGSLWYHDFSVNVIGLLPQYTVHFDLYDEAVKKGVYTVDDFAPFSHDAESGGGGNQVPDSGATLVLLGLSFVLLAVVRKKAV